MDGRYAGAGKKENETRIGGKNVLRAISEHHYSLASGSILAQLKDLKPMC